MEIVSMAEIRSGSRRPPAKPVETTVLAVERALETIELLSAAADGLSLAAEANPDAIIDVATLTGAQVVALGEEIGGYFASTEELAAYVDAASRETGEALWRLPLYSGYETQVDSDIADLKNMGKPQKGGALIAALILRRFTGGRPWVHLDIAGPARSDAERGYTTRGATAFGVRTLVALLAAVASDVNA